MRAPVHCRILPIRRHGSRTPRTSRIATCFVFRVAGATGFGWTSSTNRPHVHREVRNARSARSATPVGFQARRAIVRRAAAETDSIASRIESPAERRPRSSRDACRAARFSRSSATPPSVGLSHRHSWRCFFCCAGCPARSARGGGRGRTLHPVTKVTICASAWHARRSF